MSTHVDIESPAVSDGIANGLMPNGLGKDGSFLVIGAGSRGNAYAQALSDSHSGGHIGAIAEPIASKRDAFGRKYIKDWKPSKPNRGQAFQDWREFALYEKDRRRKELYGGHVDMRLDGVFVCTLDETHAEIITELAPLGLHVMSEKPLATTLSDCLKIYRCLQPPGTDAPQHLFSIGHVLHYSPHNMLLRKLLLESGVVGDILSIEHTEPVGWWHFSHSYVR